MDNKCLRIFILTFPRNFPDNILFLLDMIIRFSGLNEIKIEDFNIFV
jgi:hypothetical protein